MINVFVYGSLRKGFHNHDRFMVGAKYLKDAETEPIYTMISLGGFPGVFEGGDTSVKGEVYEIGLSVLQQLDQLEGHPHFYRRTKIKLKDGTEARIYLYQPPVRDSEIRQFKIASGDWMDRRELKVNRG